MGVCIIDWRRWCAGVLCGGDATWVCLRQQCWNLPPGSLVSTVTSRLQSKTAWREGVVYSWSFVDGRDDEFLFYFIFSQ